ncbi:hypothetical protein VTL71DRAFT_10742 [Oculimacula yallundae]|uniref:Uncharacterized protein n=1 Tax=Oculimacula yallundae TaxID=86028 RepID=A0ABR4CVM9_9HELO
MLPNTRLLARAFHRVPPTTTTTSTTTRKLSTSPSLRKWEGRQPEESPVREKDSHNVQHDAIKEGKAERAKGKESDNRGASQQGEGSVERAKEEFPEAPDAAIVVRENENMDFSGKLIMASYALICVYQCECPHDHAYRPNAIAMLLCPMNA